MSNLAFSAMDSGFLLQKAGKITVIIALLCMAFFITEPVMAKSYIYRAIRELSKINMRWQTRNWQEIDSSHFIVRYKPEDKNVAHMVLQVAEQSYNPVRTRFDYSPRGRTLVVVYPTKESLSHSFGWDADESAMGVYWAGVIRVLSPNAWISETDPQKILQTFETEGPVAHEFTHLIVDYTTGGNYARWFTEGIAQYEEQKLTGFQLDHDKVTSQDQMYAFSAMDRGFDNLSDQNMAYFQSLRAVDYLVSQYGEQSLNKILQELGKGLTMDQSFRRVIGVSLGQFEAGFKNWVVANK